MRPRQRWPRTVLVERLYTATANERLPIIDSHDFLMAPGPDCLEPRPGESRLSPFGSSLLMLKSTVVHE